MYKQIVISNRKLFFDYRREMEKFASDQEITNVKELYTDKMFSVKQEEAFNKEEAFDKEFFVNKDNSLIKKLSSTVELQVKTYIDHLVALTKRTDNIILREKDLSEQEYKCLAMWLLSLCDRDKIILHTFVDVAIELQHKNIHLPMPVFRNNLDRLQHFECIGVSVHSLEEAIFAQNNGAAYITYSHVFPTDCKKGLEPKGIQELKKVCKRVTIPVYALGGIKKDNESLVIEAGASGICKMSEYMQILA